jgi:hypothetical protein
VRLERASVCSLSGQCALRRLIPLLSGGRRHDGGDEFIVHLESFTETLCDQRRSGAGGQQFTERSVAVADITVTETPDKLGPTYSECASAV